MYLFYVCFAYVFFLKKKVKSRPYVCHQLTYNSQIYTRCGLSVHCVYMMTSVPPQVKGGKTSGLTLTDDWWSPIRVFIWRRVFGSLCMGYTPVGSSESLSVQHQTFSFKAFAVFLSQTQPTFYWRGTKCLWKWFQVLRPHQLLILIESKYIHLMFVGVCALDMWANAFTCAKSMHFSVPLLLYL